MKAPRSLMDQGRIVEQGSHDELHRRLGFSFDLYQSKFAENAGAALAV